jgi:hypothetical protein
MDDMGCPLGQALMIYSSSDLKLTISLCVFNHPVFVRIAACPSISSAPFFLAIAAGYAAFLIVSLVCVF